MPAYPGCFIQGHFSKKPLASDKKIRNTIKPATVIHKVRGGRLFMKAEKYGLPAPERVIIDSVDPKGPLGKAGFEKGDLILAVNKQPVPGVNAFVSMINSLSRHQKVTLLALDHRTGNTGYVQVEVN
jgi:S1-C subfamily serine protease